MTNYQIAVWLGYIGISFILGYLCAKCEDQD